MLTLHAQHRVTSDRTEVSCKSFIFTFEKRKAIIEIFGLGTNADRK